MTSFTRRRENEDLLNRRRTLRFLQGFRRSYHYRKIGITRLLDMHEGNENAPKLILVLRKELRTVVEKLAELDVQCQKAERSLDRAAQGTDARHDQVEWASLNSEHIAAARSRLEMRGDGGDLGPSIFQLQEANVEGPQPDFLRLGDAVTVLQLGTAFAAALTWYYLVLRLLGI